MATALQLVNRVRRMLGESDTSTFGGEVNEKILQAINSSKDKVFGEQVWDFLRRSDGIVQTVAEETGTTGTVTKGSTSVTLPDVTTTSGSFLRRVRFTDDSKYGSTEFRLVSYDGNDSSGNPKFTLETAWPGTTATGSATFETYSYEYVLPTDIKAVESVRHEEEDVHLIFASREHDLDAIDPTPADNKDSSPYIVVVGGAIANTFDNSNGDGTPTYGLRFGLRPVPDSILLLKYSYVLMVTNLVNTSDTLEGNIPDFVENMIVERAYGWLNFTDLGASPERGVAAIRDVDRRIRERFAAHETMPRRRFPMRRTLPAAPSSGLFGRIPESIPNPDS